MKLNAEELELLRDHKDVAPVFIKLLESTLARHVNKILSESIADGNGVKLMLSRANYDGMKMLIQEVKAHVDSGFKK